ncbi:hypothetical protein J3F84DRAFT_365332 [Trichoderma pleuroticola]
MAARNEFTVEIGIEVLLVNGLSIKQRLSLHPHTLANCEIHGRDDRFAIEATHCCENRDLLYRQLQQTLPTLVHNNNSYGSRPSTNTSNPGEACLFDGAKMKLHILPLVRPEFGFVFHVLHSLQNATNLTLDASQPILRRMEIGCGGDGVCHPMRIGCR